jgi:hypothetical protein
LARLGPLLPRCARGGARCPPTVSPVVSWRVGRSACSARHAASASRGDADVVRDDTHFPMLHAVGSSSRPRAPLDRRTW